MKLSLALLVGAASAYSSCSNDWYFQEGKSYTYDLTSKLDGQLEFLDSGVPASKVLTGQVSINTIGDCEAEITLASRLGARSQTLISGLINYGDDGLNFVKFDQANSEAQNNMLRAVISALQVNKEGALEFGTVSEQTSSGFSNSFYECNCGCDQGAHCSCEDSCGELKITKQSHVAIDADSSSLNPLAERLFTKMIFDTQVDLGASTCEISHDTGIPKIVSCYQDISTSSETSVSSSLTLRQTGVSSSKPAKQSRDSYASSSLTITTTDAHQTICNGDASCILERIPSIAQAQTDAVKNQYILRREISLMTAPELSNLIKASSKHEESLMMTQYLFTEITSCETPACASVIDYITEVASFNQVYPMVYRAAQRNPTENLISLMASDINSESSIEKMDIFNYAVSKLSSSQSAAVDAVNLANSFISSNCDFQNGSPKSLIDYFSADTNIPSESEIYQLLATLNLFNEDMLAGLDLNRIMACRMAQSTLPISEQAIILLSRMPNQSISTISPSTYSEYASVILGYFKMGYSPIEIQNTIGSVPEEISIILRAMDSTHFSMQGEQLWNKRLDILLPEGLAEIQHLAGLHLVAEGYHENMQSIKSINRLINGLGENILEVDFIVNDMVEILESSVNAGIRFSDEEWQTIINAENSMVSLVEAAINQQFDQILKTDVVSSLRTFLKMGGVSVKLYGASVELGWVGQILNNIEDVVLAMTQEREMPSLPELYSLFTSGINHEYANVLDSRQITHMPMVNGMLACITTASISSVNYEGTVLPDLMSLGSTGELQISPAVTTGSVYDVSIYGMNNIAKSILVTDTHFSVGLAAKYKYNSDKAIVKFRLLPTRTSPAHARSQYFVDYELASGVPTSNGAVSTFDLLGSEVVLQQDDSGYDLYLKNSITGQLSINGLAAHSQDHDAQASIDGLGVAKFSQKGTVTDGVVQIKLQGEGEYTDQSYAFAVKSQCMNIESCMITAAAKSPQTSYMKGSFDLSVVEDEYSLPSKINLNVNLVAGSYQILDLITSFDMSEKKIAAGTSIVSSWPTPFDVSIQCQDNLLNGFIYGYEINSLVGATECRVNSGKYDGRGLIQYKNGQVKYTINTPVGTSIGRVNSGSNSKAEVVVYKYDAGSFASWNVMDTDSLAPFELVQIRVATNLEKSQMKVTYQGHDIVAVAFKIEDLLNQEVHIEIPIIELDLGYATAIDVNNMKVQLASFFNWESKIAAKAGLPSEIESILKLLTNAEGQITTELNVQYPSTEVCSMSVANDSTAMIRLGLGTSTSCLSASMTQFQAMVQNTPSNPEIDFIAQAKYQMTGMEPELSLRIKHDFFQTISSLSGHMGDNGIGIELSTSSVVAGTTYEYSVELNGEYDHEQFLAFIQGNMNDDLFKYSLSGAVEQETIGGTSLRHITLYSEQARNEIGLVALHLYIMESNIPVGMKYITEDMDGNEFEEMKVIFTGSYGELGLNTERYSQIQPPVAVKGKYDDANVGLAARLGQNQAQLEVDWSRDLTVNAQIETSVAQFAIAPTNNAHRITLSAEPAVQMALLVRADFLSIETLYLNLQDMDFGIVRFAGQSELLIEDDDLEKLLINHAVAIKNGPEFSLNAGLNVENSEAPTLNTSEEFQWCSQFSHQSWAWLETRDLGKIGIWATHYVNDVPVCVNIISQDTSSSLTNQIAFNIDEGNMFDHAIIKSIPLSADLEYAVNGPDSYVITGTVNGQRVGGHLDMGNQIGSVRLQTDLVTGTMSVGFIFPTLKIESDLTVDGTHIVIQSDHSANPSTYAFTSNVQLSGDLSGIQEIEIIPGEYKVNIKHESSLGQLELATSEQSGLLNFDIAGHNMDAAANWQTGRGSMNLEATAHGEIASTPFNLVNSATVSDRFNLEVNSDITINTITAENALAFNFDTYDFTFSSQTPIGRANLMKEGSNGGISINLDVSGVPIVLLVQTEDENQINNAYLKVLGVPYFDIKSNQVSGQHEISIHGGSFTGEYDHTNGEFKLKGDISGVAWDVDGVYTAPGVHNSEWEVSYSRQLNVFKQETSKLQFGHALNINDQSGKILIESPLFNTGIMARLDNEILSGKFSFEADDVTINVESFEIGMLKGSVVVLKLNADNLVIDGACNIDSVNIELKMQQTLSPYVTSLDMTVTETESSINAMIHGDNKLEFSLNIPQQEASLFLGQPSSDRLDVSYSNANIDATLIGYGCNLKLATEGLNRLVLNGNVLESQINLNLSQTELRAQLQSVGPVNKLNIGANMDVIKIETELDCENEIHTGQFDLDLTSFDTSLNIESSYLTMQFTANAENIRLTIDQPAAYKTNLAIDIVGANAALEINELCNIQLHLPINDMTFMLSAQAELGELEASYDESDKLSLRFESRDFPNANLLLEITDLTNIQQVALKSQGSVADSTFQFGLDISQPILTGNVIVNGVEYALNLEPNTGALVIPDICEIEYALTNDNSVAKLSIKSPIFTMSSKVSLGDYSCMTELTTASYRAMLQTDGLNFSLLRTKVTDGNELLFELNFDGSANQFSMNYPEYPVSFQLTTNADMSQIQGDVVIGESTLKINSLDILVLPASGSLQLLTYGQDFGIDFTIDTAGFTADFQSNTFNVNAQTTQHIYLEPLSIESGLKLNAFGQKMEGLLTYENGMTNVDATVSALPVVAGVFELEMDGFTLNTLAMENINFNLMKLMVVGGASYRDGVVLLEKSQIRNTETGDMYYGLSSPIEFDLESGLSPMNNVIVHLGAVRYEVTFEDMENFELIQKLPTENVYVSAEDGVYVARFTVADFNIDSTTSISPMQQMLTVTYDNEEVFALNLQAELPQSLKMEASSGNKQMLFQFSGARYSLDANAPGVIEMSIQGNGLDLIAGHITTSIAGLEMDLKQDLTDSSLILVVDGVEIIQFSSQAMNRFNLSVQAPQTGSLDIQRIGAEVNFELNAYPYAMLGKGDLSQRHIKIALNNGQTTVATIEGEIQQDNISLTLVASNNQVRFGFIPSQQRIRYVVEVLNNYSSTGDFSPTEFNSFELTGPQGSILCNADQCEIKSDDLNMHSTLVFGESFTFYFGGMDPTVTLVDLEMTGSTGSLKVIFYDIVKAHIQRNGNKIAGKGLVLDTQLNLESTIGQNLLISANGPTAEFTIEADREHAEWNMTRPVESVATITSDELVVVALDRRFSVTSVDGLLNVQSELA